MNRFVLFIVLIFVVRDLKAQQFSLSGGGGAVGSYTTDPIIHTSYAANGDVGYYITPYFNIELEAQVGRLAGQTLNNVGFLNRYQVVIVQSNLQLGTFFGPYDDSFLTIFKSFSVGTGLGMLHDRMTNTVFGPYGIYYHPKNLMIPLKLGYEFTLLSDYGTPKVKVDLLYNYNQMLKGGLYGNFGPATSGISSYIYYSIQFKYLFNFSGPAKNLTYD